MKKKILPVVIVIALIIIISGGILVSTLIKKYAPSKVHANLNEYFNITSDADVAIVLNYENMDAHATLIDDHVYLEYQFVHDKINPRFYWDSNENILLYATSSELISAKDASSSYQRGRDTIDNGRAVVNATADSALIDIDFIKQFTNLNYNLFSDPNRVVLTTAFGDIKTTTVSKNTYLRKRGGIKSDILKDLSKDDTLTVVTEDVNWNCVMTEDGIVGYVKNSTTGDISTETITSDFKEETFNHVQFDKPICMGWHAIYNTKANDSISSLLSKSKTINVISPTWFYLDDNDGNFHDLASTSYVNTCHEKGIKVWAAFNNIENASVDTSHVLTHTSVRQNMVNQIIAAAIQYNLDGINLDFESINPAVGDAYIQFVRELSIKCENNGLVLSVDNYPPTSYTAFYNRAEQANFADYVVIMGYDEHYSGSKETGSVASINWVKSAVENTLKEVPAEQIVLGMPFYARLWCKTAPANDAEISEEDYQISSQALSMSEANELITSKGVEKTWLADIGQFYATYTENNNTYEIWLEDTNSLEERLRLLENYKLAGCSFWKLGLETPEIWDTILKYF